MDPNEVNRIRKFMGPEDAGLQINVDARDGAVEIVFSKPVQMLKLHPAQALGMSVAIAERVLKAAWPPTPPPAPPAPPSITQG
jgi:hypothetical protein